MLVAILGMGKMGRNLAQKLMADGHSVVVWNRSREILEKLRVEYAEHIVNQKFQIVHSIDQLRDTLPKARIILMMLPAGEITEDALDTIKEGVAERGDIVIDGGNSYYLDTEERYEECTEAGIKYLGIGVSGGIHGLLNGYPLMVGGDKSGYEYIKIVLDSLAKPNGGHTYFGEGGVGHFVKMVHNGIEYGMMQAIAEGFAVLAKSDYKPNLIEAGNNWQRGSIISSFLIWNAVSAMIKDPNLDQFDGFIDAKGEGEWTVETAKTLNVPTPVIEAALEFRKRSQYDKGVQETYVAKMVAALRHEFGGHEIHKSEDPSSEPPKGSES